jgi:hypothetical protein
MRIDRRVKPAQAWAPLEHLLSGENKNLRELPWGWTWQADKNRVGQAATEENQAKPEMKAATGDRTDALYVSWGRTKINARRPRPRPPHDLRARWETPHKKILLAREPSPGGCVDRARRWAGPATGLENQNWERDLAGGTWLVRKKFWPRGRQQNQIRHRENQIDQRLIKTWPRGSENFLHKNE